MPQTNSIKSSEKSTIRSFLDRVLSFDKSKVVPETQILPVLLEELRISLGVMKPVTTPIRSRIPSRLFLTTSGKANSVKKILSQMDFSVVQINSNGYTGGVRWEADSDKTTVVNYCDFSGVLAISSTLNFES